MTTFFSLFDADTQYGNRLHEHQFLWFLLSRVRENDVQRVDPTDFKKLVAQARDEPWNNSAAVLSLANILVTSLEPRAYDLFIQEIGEVVARFIFYEVSEENSEFPDYDKIKKANYQKYRLYKFASFLDLLRPGHIYWCGQPESESIRLAERGLDHFWKANLQGQVATIARWIRQPGPSAFSAKQEIRSRTIRQRRALSLKLEGLKPREVAQRLDEEGIEPSHGYSSHAEHYEKNPNSFQVRLSKDRSAARKMSKPSMSR